MVRMAIGRKQARSGLSVYFTLINPWVKVTQIHSTSVRVLKYMMLNVFINLAGYQIQYQAFF